MHNGQSGENGDVMCAFVGISFYPRLPPISYRKTFTFLHFSPFPSANRECNAPPPPPFCCCRCRHSHSEKSRDPRRKRRRDRLLQLAYGLGCAIVVGRREWGEEEHFFSYFEHAATRLCRRSDDDNLTKSERENPEVKQGHSPADSAHEKESEEVGFFVRI